MSSIRAVFCLVLAFPAFADPADEWVDLAQLDQATAIVLRFLREQP